MEPQLYCPSCKQIIKEQDFFCSICGKKLKEKPQSITIFRQILVYLLSFLLPPLGLWPAVKYLRQRDGKSKIVGLVAVVLTIISTVITIWLYLRLMDTISQQLNQQLNVDLLELYR